MFVLKGLTKYMAMIVYMHNVSSSVAYVREIFVAVGTETNDRHAILFKWSKLFMFLFKLFAFTICFPFFLFCLFPVVVYFVTGQRVVLFPVLIPFLDETEVKGYLVLTSIHAIWSVQSAVGLTGSDIIMAFLFLQVLPMVEIIELSFKEFNETCLLHRTFSNKMLLKMQLRNILQMHKELAR